MYNLKSNSRSAKFYKWIWGTDVTDFRTMCPYFWKYTLTILFIIPILVGKGIYYIIPAKKKVAKRMEYIADSKVGEAVTSRTEKIFTPNKVWNGIGKTLKWSYFIVMGGFALMVIGRVGYHFYVHTIEMFAIIGVIATVIALIFTIVGLNDSYSLGSKIAHPFKLFGDMISSLYHNMCPLIKWN